jgi:hypothetical protein
MLLITEAHLHAEPRDLRAKERDNRAGGAA